jgi:hypothetical protein
LERSQENRRFPELLLQGSCLMSDACAFARVVLYVLFGTFNLVTSVTANAASPSDRLNRAAYLAASTRNAAFPVRDSIFDQACDFAHWHLSDLSDHADDRGKSDIAVPSAGPEMTKAVVHQLALACSDGF